MLTSWEISIISKQNKYQDDENILFSFLFNENQCVFYYGMNKRSVILTTDENSCIRINKNTKFKCLQGLMNKGPPLVWKNPTIKIINRQIHE